MSNVLDVANAPTPLAAPSESTTGLLRELVSHLREKRTELPRTGPAASPNPAG